MRGVLVALIALTMASPARADGKAIAEAEVKTADGKAVGHAKPNDYATNRAGDAGDRIACGEIKG